MSVYSLLMLISFIMLVFIGAMVLSRNPTATLNRMFFAMIVLGCINTMGRFGLSISYTYEQAYFWWRLNFIVPVLYASGFYFGLMFFENERFYRNPIFLISLISSTAVFAITWAINPYLFVGLLEKVRWGWYFRIDKDQPLFMIILFGVWTLGLIMLAVASAIISYRKKTDPNHRRIVIYLLATFFIIAVEPITIILKSIYPWDYPPVLGFVLIIGIMIVSYSIWKYRMFELTPVTTAQNIVKLMTDGLLLVDKQRRIAWYNRSTGEMIDYEMEEIIGQPVNSLFWEEVDPTEWIYSEEDEENSSDQIGYRETYLRTKTGKRIPVSLSGSSLFDSRKVIIGFIIIIRDITERIEKDAELEKYRYGLEQLVEQRTQELIESNRDLERSREQLRFLGERLVDAKESESARIARELHDELGQLLTSMKIDLTLLNRHLKNKGEKSANLSTRCQGLLDINDTAIKSVQHITKGLRPPILDDIGLSAALKSMIRDFESRTHIECSITNGIGDERYESAFSTAVYRIVQESLTNVTRHAEADKVSIQMSIEQGYLRVSIIDNGKGIDNGKASSFHSFGILGMMERARSFDGELKVKAVENNGTEVELLIPIRRSIDDANTNCR